MKEIEIDEAYSIKHDGVCWNLIHRQVKKRKKSDRDGRWSKGDNYITEDKTYYPTIKMALTRYLLDCTSDCNDVRHIVDKINEAEQRINNLNIVIK